MSAPPPPPSALPPLPPAVALPPRAGISLTWRRVVVLLLGVALVAVVATVLTIGGLVAGLGYYADQQEAARPTEPARRPYVAPAYQAPRNDPAPVMPLYAPPVSPIDWQAERERAKQEERVRQLEERQRELEREMCNAQGRTYRPYWGC